ncbi:hypothetical protein QE197_10125 [Arsenophonus nasoniae]|uniref:Uncharacterized protein n=1 Tax=Arsenophonus nasoniae TaxID=638 RepID=D2TXJ1_9GAMM|nr:hypothetical protein [Arsenophonus nasoniae]QBY43812.1 hypothetical protein ArsFIN_23810 [Arsenophonus nasoniae]WGM04159.1 hypothetical protein QE258_10845 [Arsenophonus nasoniae]WGM09263.1 hypothetical protein QE197_10125 [Arsenophonus nasoniae]WGM13985.1 hypothetical protein QE193_10010 [Arsenophonus nasoniae]CBA72108.1 hypothetical protein ARN_08130 [Arsenophonus nasoniae]
MIYSLNEVTGFGRIEMLEENLNAFSYQDKTNYPTKFYLFFTAIDRNNNYITFNETVLANAIYNQQIKLVNFLTGLEYTLGASAAENKDFFASRFFIKNDINVIEITAGNFYGYAPISVVFTINNNSKISTEFMSLSGFESRVLIARNK